MSACGDIDQGTTRPGGSFGFSAWVRRGNCVHAATSDDMCSDILEATLEAMNQRHQVEYNAASSMLALLPTIGALFGAPTVEIWMLSTILPIGGVLAMLLSFGSSIMPSKSGEYETALARTTPNAPSGSSDRGKLRPDADAVKEIVLRHLNSREQLALPRVTVMFGLAAMALLFGAAQAGMVVVVIGSVYASWCRSQWWLHLWYLVGTTLARRPLFL
ncbi:hypothetical protein IMZ48_00005 [Candidatus Bathyarchaeota archaeon]|nr:hypothetical protein [Candidatus Bathyarchaeota archaeon]